MVLHCAWKGLSLADIPIDGKGLLPPPLKSEKEFYLLGIADDLKLLLNLGLHPIKRVAPETGPKDWKAPLP